MAPVITFIDLVESSLLEHFKVFFFSLRDEAVARKVFAEPSTAAITKTVCVVSWGAVGDSLGGSGVDVAQCVCGTLEIVCAEFHLVGQDEVVG